MRVSSNTPSSPPMQPSRARAPRSASLQRVKDGIEIELTKRPSEVALGVERRRRRGVVAVDRLLASDSVLRASNRCPPIGADVRFPRGGRSRRGRGDEYTPSSPPPRSCCGRRPEAPVSTALVFAGSTRD